MRLQFLVLCVWLTVCLSDSDSFESGLLSRARQPLRTERPRRIKLPSEADRRSLERQRAEANARRQLLALNEIQKTSKVNSKAGAGRPLPEVDRTAALPGVDRQASRKIQLPEVGRKAEGRGQKIEVDRQSQTGPKEPKQFKDAIREAFPQLFQPAYRQAASKQQQNAQVDRSDPGADLYLLTDMLCKPVEEVEFVRMCRPEIHTICDEEQLDEIDQVHQNDQVEVDGDGCHVVTDVVCPVTQPKISRPTQRPGSFPGPTQRPGPFVGPTQRPGPFSGPTQRPGPIPGPTQRPGQFLGPTQRPGPFLGPTQRPGLISGRTQRPGPIPGPTQRPGPTPGPTQRPGPPDISVFARRNLEARVPKFVAKRESETDSGVYLSHSGGFRFTPDSDQQLPPINEKLANVNDKLKAVDQQILALNRQLQIFEEQRRFAQDQNPRQSLTNQHTPSSLKQPVPIFENQRKAIGQPIELGPEFGASSSSAGQLPFQQPQQREQSSQFISSPQLNRQQQQYPQQLDSSSFANRQQFNNPQQFDRPQQLGQPQQLADVPQFSQQQPFQQPAQPRQFGPTPQQQLGRPQEQSPSNSDLCREVRRRVCPRNPKARQKRQLPRAPGQKKCRDVTRVRCRPEKKTTQKMNCPPMQMLNALAYAKDFGGYYRYNEINV